MLLWLAELLAEFHSGFLVVQYITLRGILSVLTALFIAFWVGPIMIRKLQEKQVGQAIRDDGPKSHLSKAGTPTMGGALILIAIVISTLLWADTQNFPPWIRNFPPSCELRLQKKNYKPVVAVAGVRQDAGGGRRQATYGLGLGA